MFTERTSVGLDVTSVFGSRADWEASRIGLAARARSEGSLGGIARSVKVSVTEVGADLVRAITSVRHAEIAQILAEMPPWGRGQAGQAVE